MTWIARRTFVGTAALALSGLVAAPARAVIPTADQEAVSAVEGYLDGIKTLQARFQQINPNGGMASGTVYISRPGKMRLDYDPPARIMLVATDWRLIFQDNAVKQVNQIPLASTPLSFLLANRVDLGNEVEVTDVQRHSGETALTVIKKGAADQGNVVVVFSEQPMELRRWTVTDPQGLVTQVVLAGVKAGIPLDPSLFQWQDPTLFGWPKS